MARNIRLNCNVSESSRFARRIRRSPSIARFWALLLPLALLSFAAKSAHAQTNYYWDPNFSNSIPGSDNNGTWDTISGIWFNPDLGTDTSWVNDPAAIANIGTSGNVSPQVITMVRLSPSARSISSAHGRQLHDCRRRDRRPADHQ